MIRPIKVVFTQDQLALIALALKHAAEGSWATPLQSLEVQSLSDMLGDAKLNEVLADQGDELWVCA